MDTEKIISIKENVLMESVASMVKKKIISELDARIFLSQLGIHYSSRDKNLREAIEGSCEGIRNVHFEL